MHEIDWNFWIVVMGAVVAKTLLSPFHSFYRSGVSILVAVFVAWAFTDAVIRFFDINQDEYGTEVAAIVAVTGEGVFRWIIGVSEDPSRLVKLLREWRSGK